MAAPCALQSFLVAGPLDEAAGMAAMKVFTHDYSVGGLQSSGACIMKQGSGLAAAPED